MAPLLVFLLTALANPLESQAQSVRISNLHDLDLGVWTGSGDLEDEDPVCIYSTTGDYRIRASGTGAAGAFSLSMTGSAVTYETHFKEAGGSFVSLTANSWSNFSGADSSSSNCNGLTNATVKVIARASSLSGARAGNYGGTLTLLVEPR
ncbi:MAG: hypothetical protein EBZ48_10510 [Proteobacteria bacterium]|nr:hypothetical protein [Pseudomonadota bacterium]